jgi:hypothetical protein
MCTVTWRHEANGYDVCFSRDELHRRAPESAPAPGRAGDTAYLAPRDGDRGGTWLLANEHGLTFCLLNDYADPWSPPSTAPVLSRGHLPLAVAAARNADEAWSLLGREDLSRRRSFVLLVFAPGHPPARIHGRGGSARYDRAVSDRPPVCSSSWRHNDVVAARVEAYRGTVPARPSSAALRAYHLAHDPDRGAHSVRMIRPDARTRSILHVRVDPRRVRLHYLPLEPSPAPPSGAWSEIALDRARACAAAKE